jgi:hypothetical protein
MRRAVALLNVVEAVACGTVEESTETTPARSVVVSYYRATYP